MYSLNFDLINNPVIAGDSVNLNKIAGTLPDGASITVQRALRGWTAHLFIEVNGVRLHEEAPSLEEREGFDRLRERALDAQDVQRENARLLARMSSATFFTPLK